MPLSNVGVIPEQYRPIMVCVDDYQDKLLCGKLYSAYYSNGICYKNTMQLLDIIRDLLQRMNRPQPSMEKRTFLPLRSEKNLQMIPDFPRVIEEVRGKAATFKIKILFQQNASWQGSVAWLEQNCEETFRSALELLFLIDSAFDSQQHIEKTGS